MRKPQLGMLIVAALVAVVIAGCDDDSGRGERQDGTLSPSQPAATANPSVIRSFTGGEATASVTVAGQVYAYEGGTCTVGADDEYITVNIGDVGGDHYFGVIAGRSPAADADTRSTAGGGEFSGDDVLITFVGEGNGFVLRSADTALTLSADLSSGTFTSLEATNSAEVRGEFSC